jgi:hypothetical protein
MTKARKPEWPTELNNPIVIGTPSRATLPFGSLVPDRDDLADQLRAEMQRRLELIAKHLRIKPPKTLDPEWLRFTAAICTHWQIPGFMPPTEKVSRAKWTNHKLCELFADVHSLTIAGRLTPNGACGHIADFPAKFGERYPLKDSPKAKKALAKTLHRQYVAVKNKIKSNAKFRHSYFGTSLGAGILNQSTPDFGPELYRVAIERYASKAPPKVA